MVVPCLRCGKKIVSPDASNADYIIAEDTKVMEIRDGLPVDVQKTGVACPDCYRPTDFVIWGVHKSCSRDLDIQGAVEVTKPHGVSLPELTPPIRDLAKEVDQLKADIAVIKGKTGSKPTGWLSKLFKR